tara:strand:+ start:297 stop:443 length:147 start_codon:yes stop_codon:yes gene_type:complete
VFKGHKDLSVSKDLKDHVVMAQQVFKDHKDHKGTKGRKGHKGNKGYKG